VVIAREYGANDQRLVAYLVPGRNPVPSQSGLRKGLARVIPDYMLPSAFVSLEALPLTTNGKVDRRALPAPGPSRPRLDTAFVPPCTRLEEMLAGIWAEVVGINPIGANDNFFELGGNSLLAAQVVSRLHHALGLDLPLRRFFETPTLAGLAVAVVQSQAEKAGEQETLRILEELEKSPADGLSGAPEASGREARRQSG
jgi:acyl carrier protein